MPKPKQQDVPAPTAAGDTDETVGFEALGLHESVYAAIRDAGYTTPTPIQREAIPLARRGRDLIGLAQTGTGKTAAFTLPIIDRLIDGPRRTRALILTPTRELCVQVEESFRKYAKHAPIAVVAVYGGVPLEPQEKKLRGGVDVVVATPGRLIDHLERQNVVFDDLEVLVLDEADRMLDMGFAPQINRIVSEIPNYRQTLLFSATMPPEVEALARKYLRKPIVVQVGVRSAAASTVTHAVYPVPREKKNALLVRAAHGGKEHETVLIFTRTKHGADRVVRDLEKAGVRATAMHADKTQAQRMRALQEFKERQDQRARGDGHRAARAGHLRHHARHQLRRAAAGGGLRAPHRAHGARGEGRGRLHVHGARRDRDGAHDRAGDRPADPAHLRAGLRLRDGRRGLSHQRSRPSRDTTSESAARPRRAISVRFAAP